MTTRKESAFIMAKHKNPLEKEFLIQLSQDQGAFGFRQCQSTVLQEQSDHIFQQAINTKLVKWGCSYAVPFVFRG